MEKMSCKICADTGVCPFCESAEELSENHSVNSIYTRANFNRLLYRFIELSSVFENMMDYLEEKNSPVLEGSYREEEILELIRTLVGEYTDNVQDDYIRNISDTVNGEE